MIELCSEYLSVLCILYSKWLSCVLSTYLSRKKFGMGICLRELHISVIKSCRWFVWIVVLATIYQAILRIFHNHHELFWELTFVVTAWKVSKYGFFSGPYFPAFGLNTVKYSVSLRIQSECGKIQARKNSVFGYFSHSVLILDQETQKSGQHKKYRYE